MIRRDFIKLAAAAGAVAMAGPASRAQAAPAAPRKYRKGYFMGAFPPNGALLPWLEKFKLVRDAGFEAVEVPSHLNQDEILRARDATGLKIVGVACGSYTRFTSLPDPAKRRFGAEGLMQGLREAKAYGASTALCVPGGINASIYYADQYRRTHEAIALAVPVAEEVGIKIAIENVVNRSLISPLECARYVDEFQSPAVGWQFDVGNVGYIGWPQHWIPVLGKRIQKVHIKEYSRSKMTGDNLASSLHVDYLEGDNDWKTIMAELDKVDYEPGWCIAEPGYHPPGVPPGERLKQVSAKLTRILEA